VTRVPAAKGEIVEVIVVRRAHDAEHACAPVASAEFSDTSDRRSRNEARRDSLVDVVGRGRRGGICRIQRLRMD
jgi:hypothetical protein